jgi:arginine utilization protein RocB
MGCLDKVFETAKNEYGETMAIKDFYGLSDLSYTDLDASMNFDGIFKNVVGNGAMYELPVEDMKRFHIPSSIVMGGYGKDFHKTTERLNMKYNFDVLPYLYIQLITDLLNG